MENLRFLRFFNELRYGLANFNPGPSPNDHPRKDPFHGLTQYNLDPRQHPRAYDYQ